MTIGTYEIVALLQVYDMAASLRFYRDGLGFTVAEQSPGGEDCDWVLLKLERAQLMLNTAYEKSNRPYQPDKERMLAHKDTSLYFLCPDIEIVYQQFTGAGLIVEKPAVTKYNFKALNLEDPDGFSLCFHSPLNPT